MKITQSQQQFLNNLICERLTANPINKVLLNGFVSKYSVGQGLISDLKSSGFQEDLDGAIAYYIIKDQTGLMQCFFSLKCGSLFDPSYHNEIKSRIERCNEALKRIRTGAQSRSQEETLLLLEQIRSGWGLPDDEFDDEFDGGLNEESLTKKLRYNQSQLPDNKMLLRVATTHSGGELVHFCANDAARNQWMQSGISRPIGEVLFWNIISDIICQIQQMVGCQYVYLFAGDYSENGSLLNHYRVSMNFHELDGLGTSLPDYDLGCTFLCQEICELKRQREYYFENFNPDLDDELV